MRKTGLLLLVLVLLLAGCKTPTQPPIETFTPAPAASDTPAPSAVPSETAFPPTESPTEFIPPTPGPLTEPAVLNRYPLPPGEQGQSVEATPGRIWVGTTAGALLEYDAASGALLHIYLLVTESYDKIAPVKDLAFDGQHLWAIVAWQDSVLSETIEIFVINPATGEAQRRINASDQDPERLGLGPGQIWTQNLVFDTATLEVSAVAMNTDSTVFGPDGQGGMWAGGTSACDDCPSSLYRFPSGELFNAQPGPSASDQALHIQATRQRLWVVNGDNRLDGYDLDPLPGADTQPAVQVDLSGDLEMTPAAVVYDGMALWLLSAAGRGGGMLYQYDPSSGQRVGALAVGDAEGEIGQARVPAAAVYDGHDLWVLTSFDLVQVGLPWTR